jgi:hypothetical protein
VGGLLDCVSLSETTDLWLNDEGLLLELPFNRLVVADGRALPVVGDFYVAAHDGEGNTVSIDDAALALWARLLRRH